MTSVAAKELAGVNIILSIVVSVSACGRRGYNPALARTDGGIDGEVDGGPITCGDQSGFAFKKTIRIDRAAIDDATLTDYPLLYSVIDSELRDTVNDVQGDDIRFVGTDSSTCAATGPPPCVLDHEIERWDPNVGLLVAWVRVPVLNTSLGDVDSRTEASATPLRRGRIGSRDLAIEPALVGVEQERG